MKPDPIDLRGVDGVRELVRRVMRTRFDEVRRLAGGFDQRDQRGLHALRIACKRLRYAAERFCKLEPSLKPLAEVLSTMQDALGEAHDRDVLLAILPPSMGATERRLRVQREAYVDRATALWAEVGEKARACTLIFFE